MMNIYCLKKKCALGRWLLGLLISLFTLSCSDDDTSTFDQEASVQLTSFSIEGVAGDINQESGLITLRLPFGTDPSELSPQLGLPEGAKSIPANGERLNFTGDVAYTLYNGNQYKRYTIRLLLEAPFGAFTIQESVANVDHIGKSISVLLPDGTPLEALTVQVDLEPGVLMQPTNGSVVNFEQPVKFTFEANGTQVEYTVSALSNSIAETAFLGTAASREQLTNPDEIAAANWFFTTYPYADYLPFQSIASGVRLSNYKMIWWHYDAVQDLPVAALESSVIDALKSYRAAGGTLLLTTYAVRYVEALGIVPEGRGPNNVFGDFGTGGFVAGDDWGISFRGNESHPIFAELRTFEPGKAYLLSAGSFRQNHTAWWFLPEWGGYGNGANWRELTGGIHLASEAWDDYLDGRVGIAEWPNTNQGNVVVIAFGAYDWYSEPLGGGDANGYLDNIQKLTKNSIDYLLQQAGK